MSCRAWILAFLLVAAWGCGGGSRQPTITGCAQILSCVILCPEATYDDCAGDCVSQGTTRAQQLFTALDVCWESADADTCETVCNGPDENACDTCLDTACEAQYAACAADQ